MNVTSIIKYLLIALIIVILGAFAGWFFFVRSQLGATQTTDQARGLTPAQTTPAAPSSAGGGFFSGVFTTLFGGGTGVSSSDNQSLGNTSGTQSGSGAVKLPQLWHVSTTPTAGIAFIGTSTVQLRFVERSSGYVFAASPQTGTVMRLTNTLMPKIYQALFSSTGEVAERSLDQSGNITTFVGAVATTTASDSVASSTPLVGAYLPARIAAIAADPASGSLFALSDSSSGAAGVLEQQNGTHQKQIFSSTIPRWRVSWLPDGRIILEQNPADSLPSYAYALTSSGSLSALMGGVPGLTVLPKSGSAALLWGESNGGLSLFAQLSPTTTAARLPIATVADKCAWAPQGDIAYCGVPETAPTGNFLDDWYKGLTHTSDAIWRIDASSGQAEVFFTPDTSQSLDVVEPTIDASGNYLAFLNATDQSVWLLRLSQ